MNNVIAITGPSGVGKTFVARLVCACLPSDQTLVLNGDDLHKWPRTSPKWGHYTHLNPAANNLKKGYKDLLDLKNSKSIKRKVYDHNTGQFVKNVEMIPKKNIVFEGLHTLYGDEYQNIADLKIYVDTDVNLKTKWKIERDVRYRSYTRQEVLDHIRRRRSDEKKFIVPQKESADIVVRFIEKDEDVFLDYSSRFTSKHPLMEKVKNLHELQHSFVRACRSLSKKPNLAQNGGGNLSYKYDDKIIITTSGTDFAEVTVANGHIVCPLQPSPGVQDYLIGDRPSMEIGAHRALPGAVLHTHPLCLNTILCAAESQQIVEELYGGYEYKYIEYVTPGDLLADKIKSTSKKIIFAENHGLFVSAPTVEECESTTSKLEEISKRYLAERNPRFVEFKDYDNKNNHGPVFPDAVVLREKNKKVNSYLVAGIYQAGLTPRFLQERDMKILMTMDSELYRKERHQT
jgi:uridine kinase